MTRLAVARTSEIRRPYWAKTRMSYCSMWLVSWSSRVSTRQPSISSLSARGGPKFGALADCAVPKGTPEPVTTRIAALLEPAMTSRSMPAGYEYCGSPLSLLPE